MFNFKNTMKIYYQSGLLIVVILISSILFYIALYLIPLPQFKSYSKEIYSAENELIAVYLTNDDKWRMQVKIDEVSSELTRAILEKEDKWFYYHIGINPISLVRATIVNIISGKRKLGASTITMQIARMINYSERTYWNKLLEMFLAIRLEMHFTKDEILELYMNYLPMGGNIEGVKSASYIYFNRPPSQLSLSQAIVLTLIPNNPNKLRLDKNPNYVKIIRDKWIKRFLKREIFSQEDLYSALNEELPEQRYNVEITAPHFCHRVRMMSKNNIIRTTLELPIQSKVEKLLRKHVEKLKIKGITNGAVLVINNSTHSVSAYCGSADFDDKQNSGEVDGILAWRSPGSTLKSGLYALAFDIGFLTPKMKLLDIPTDFDGYIPENFSLDYKGEVTVEYALRHSLNIPAVRLLKEIGLSEFVGHLSDASFDLIAKNRNNIGLSMILGGCAVTLEQLTRYYGSFANEGKYYDIKYIAGGTVFSKKIFSSGAIYIISEILSNNERSDFPNELLYWTKLPKIAWKTGTSYGKRDAWAIGYNTHYTVGVWIGNFDGKGSPYLVGSETALPLLFEIFNAVDYGNKEWFKKPNSVESRYVCSETGLILDDSCKNLIYDYHIVGVSHNRICELYKDILTDSLGNIQYCKDCIPNDKYKVVMFPFYNPELLMWFNSKGIKNDLPPPHNPNCPQKLSGLGPQIVSPSVSWEYYIDNNAKQEIMLQAVSEAGVFRHYWYIDEKYFAIGIPGEKIFFKPEKKEHKITCLDDRGRLSSIIIKISYY